MFSDPSTTIDDYQLAFSKWREKHEREIRDAIKSQRTLNQVKRILILVGEVKQNGS